MKTIIAGGRGYRFTAADVAKLDSLRGQISEVVSGGAAGADMCGEEWARARGIPVRTFPAIWHDLSQPGALIRTRADGTKYDAKAGFRRNEQMAAYAEACVLFPGGNGTADMARRAKQHGLIVHEFRGQQVAQD